MIAYGITEFGDVENIKAQELEPPHVMPGEILVRVKAASLNPADIKVLTGRDGGKYLRASSLPLVLGFDFSGIVESTSSGVDHIAQGDTVFGFLPYSRRNKQGSFADLIAVPAATVATKPETVSHVEASCSATARSTALQALRDKGGMNSSKRVLVNGASGGVGSFGVQLARIAGAEVWGTSSENKMEFVSSLGANKVVNYKTTPINMLGTTFDIVFDAASQASFGTCRPITAAHGCYITLLPSPRFIAGVVRSLMSSRHCRTVLVQSKAEDLRYLAEHLENESLRSPVDRVYSQDALSEAFKRLDSGAGKGKIGIEFEW